ncbi:MAG: lamin tail domain-containing protein [bacterium]
MSKTLGKMVLIPLLLGMLCYSSCIGPSDDSFDISDSVPKILVINEIVSSSSGDGNDWIELYNVCECPVYLKDYSIVDNNIEHDPFPLPDITLESNDFFVLLATEEEPEDGSYYVPFRLGADDSLTLYWGLAIVDVLDWEEGQAPNGCSYGRFPDGSGAPSTLLPTRGFMNKRIFRPLLVINEIVASPAEGGSDWIELYVDSNDSVYLGDYALVDDAEGRELAPLPDDITLEPGEFFVILATDEKPEDDSYYVPFRLGADDCVTLYMDSNIVDVLDWEDGQASEGYSYGCFPDGTKLDGTKELWTLTPTPGQPNKKPRDDEMTLYESNKI